MSNTCAHISTKAKQVAELMTELAVLDFPGQAAKSNFLSSFGSSDV